MADELRYRPERRSKDAVVMDDERKEIFCVIPESIMWGGVDAAHARAKDIALMFNRPSPTIGAGDGELRERIARMVKLFDPDFETHDDFADRIIAALGNKGE
jgi:hypothetical protein